MKILVSKRAGQRASILLLSLLVAGIAGVTLASYLILAQSQNFSVYRSQGWNTSMVMTEAGVEDALQLINKYSGALEAEDLYQWTNNVGADNWQTLAPNVYYVRRYLTNATTSTEYTSFYDVWITNQYNKPTITSIGFVPWTQVASVAPRTFFASLPGADGTVESAQLVKVPILRQVDVQTTYDTVFTVAMAAVSTIDLRGRNIATDSYDSADPAHSYNGYYPFLAPARIKDNGTVCTDATIVGSLNVGNAKVRGRVKTGPGTQTMDLGPLGSVGDAAWVTSGTKGIKPGWSATDFNVLFPDVKMPEVTWLPAVEANTTINGTNYQYVLTSAGNYDLTGVSGSVLVDAPADAIIKVKISSDVKFSGQQVIRILPSGAKLRIYMEGSLFSLTGQAYIDNQSNHPDNFYLFGLPTCTGIVFGGNASFTGGIYAPEAAFTLGGGGNDIYDFIGASVTYTVVMNGHFRFHYDENLGRIGPGKGFIPTAWKEKPVNPAFRAAAASF